MQREQKQLKEWVQLAVYGLHGCRSWEKCRVNVLKGCSAQIDCLEIYDWPMRDRYALVLYFRARERDRDRQTDRELELENFILQGL